LGARTDRVLVGEIGAPQGLKGEVRLRSYTKEPQAIAEYGPLQDETGARSFEIETVRGTPKALIARFKNVPDRDAAAALTGTKLYVLRSRLPAREADEWYYADLIGLAVVDEEGAPLGTVAAIHNFGAGDIVEIRPVEGGPDLLVPFTETTVPKVDIDAGRLTVIVPEGLID
jgi:16S rRNA processing protein RimM